MPDDFDALLDEVAPLEPAAPDDFGALLDDVAPIQKNQYAGATPRPSVGLEDRYRIADLRDRSDRIKRLKEYLPFTPEGEQTQRLLAASDEDLPRMAGEVLLEMKTKTFGEWVASQQQAGQEGWAEPVHLTEANQATIFNALDNEGLVKMRNFVEETKARQREALGSKGQQLLASAARGVESGVMGSVNAVRQVGHELGQLASLAVTGDVRSAGDFHRSKTAFERTPEWYQRVFDEEAQTEPILKYGGQAIHLAFALPFIHAFATKATSLLSAGQAMAATTGVSAGTQAAGSMGGFAAFNAITTDAGAGERGKAGLSGAIFAGILGSLSGPAQKALVKWLPTASERSQRALAQALVFGFAGTDAQLREGGYDLSKIDPNQVVFDATLGAGFGAAGGRHALAGDSVARVARRVAERPLTRAEPAPTARMAPEAAGEALKARRVEGEIPTDVARRTPEQVTELRAGETERAFEPVSAGDPRLQMRGKVADRRKKTEPVDVERRAGEADRRAALEARDAAEGGEMAERARASREGMPAVEPVVAPAEPTAPPKTLRERRAVMVEAPPATDLRETLRAKTKSELVTRAKGLGIDLPWKRQSKEGLVNAIIAEQGKTRGLPAEAPDGKVRVKHEGRDFLVDESVFDAGATLVKGAGLRAEVVENGRPTGRFETIPMEAVAELPGQLRPGSRGAARAEAEADAALAPLPGQVEPGSPAAASVERATTLKARRSQAAAERAAAKVVPPAHVENLRTEDVQSAFPKATVTERPYGWSVQHRGKPEVRVVRVNEIKPTPEGLAEYGLTMEQFRQMKADGETIGISGAHGMIRGKDVIRLAKGSADAGTITHESFHAAMKLALTDVQRRRVVREFGSEEAAAEAYASWNPATKHGAFTKIREYFRGMAQKFGLSKETAEDVFRKVKSGEAWEKGGGKEGGEQFQIKRRKPTGPANTQPEKPEDRREVPATLRERRAKIDTSPDTPQPPRQGRRRGPITAAGAHIGSMFGAIRRSSSEGPAVEQKLRAHEREVNREERAVRRLFETADKVTSARKNRKALQDLASENFEPGKNYGFSRLETTYEGIIEPTPAEKIVIDVMRGYVYEGRGRRAEMAGVPGFKNRSDRLPRVTLPDMHRVLREGTDGKDWKAVEAAFADFVPDAKKWLLEAKADLEGGGPIGADKKSQFEFSRQLPRVPAFVKSGNRTLRLYETNSNRLLNMLHRRGTRRLAFGKVFGWPEKGQPDPRDLVALKKKFVEAGGSESMFDTVMRVAQGEPLHDPKDIDVGVRGEIPKLRATSSFLKSTVLGRAWKAAFTEWSGPMAEIVGMPEATRSSIEGVGAAFAERFAGVRTLKTERLRSAGAQPSPRWPIRWADPNRQFESRVDRAADVVSEATLMGPVTRALNQLNYNYALERWVNKAKAGKAHMGATIAAGHFRVFGEYSHADARRLATGGGTGAEYRDAMRRISSNLSGMGMSPLSKGLFEQGRTPGFRWMRYVPFKGYATTQLRTEARYLKDIGQSVKKGPKEFSGAMYRWSRHLVGRAAQSITWQLLGHMLAGGSFAQFQKRWEENPEGELAVAVTTAMFAGSYGQMAYGFLGDRLSGDDTPAALASGIATSLWPVSIAGDAFNVAAQQGRYEGMDLHEALLASAMRWYPQSKDIAGLIALSGIAGEDERSRQDLRNSLRAFYRFRHGPTPRGYTLTPSSRRKRTTEEEVDARDEFRGAILETIRRMKEFDYEGAKKELMVAVGTKSEKEARRSILSRRVLATNDDPLGRLSKLEKETYKSGLTERTVKDIQAYDKMLQGLADWVYDPSTKSSEATGGRVEDDRPPGPSARATGTALPTLRERRRRSRRPRQKPKQRAR